MSEATKDRLSELMTASKVRMLAQEAYGSDEVVIRDAAPLDQVEDGYWVEARLWVPKEWVQK